MKLFLSLTLALLFPILLLAQDDQNATATQIDQQVWQPFKKAYAEGDATLYNSLHTDDVLRITTNGIKEGEAYKKQIVAAFSRKDRSVRTIDFVFEQRTYAKDIGYEVGYYKVVYAKADGSTGESYGRFHVVLKKIDEQWKIAQDWDSSNINGHKVNKEDFERLEN